MRLTIYINIGAPRLRPLTSFVEAVNTFGVDPQMPGLTLHASSQGMRRDRERGRGFFGLKKARFGGQMISYNRVASDA